MDYSTPGFPGLPYTYIYIYMSRWFRGKESACSGGDRGSIPGLGRSLGGGHGSPLQYSYLEYPMDRGAWQATVHKVAETDMTEATEHSTHTHTRTHTHTHIYIYEPLCCTPETNIAL